MMVTFPPNAGLERRQLQPCLFAPFTKQIWFIKPSHQHGSAKSYSSVFWKAFSPTHAREDDLSFLPFSSIHASSTYLLFNWNIMSTPNQFFFTHQLALSPSYSRDRPSSHEKQLKEAQPDSDSASIRAQVAPKSTANALHLAAGRWQLCTS